jgi:hypothetical protein
MKNINKIAFSFICLCFAYTSFAQIKVETDGRLKLGNEISSPSWSDPTKFCTMNAFGKGTDTYRAGSKLSFGDFGTPVPNLGANVFVGELGDTDSDALQLHGKNGVYFSAGGEGTYFVGGINPGGDLHIRSVLQEYSTVLSDIRFKNNIKPFKGGLSYIKKMNAITYDLKADKEEAYLASLDNVRPEKERGRNDVINLKKSITDGIKNKKDQIGFSAQDIQLILPQIVKKDTDTDYLSVNYIALIPVLVEAIKEQQTTIETQAAAIDAMQKDIIALKKKVGL